MTKTIEERREYVRLYMREWRRKHPCYSTPYVGRWIKEHPEAKRRHNRKYRLSRKMFVVIVKETS
jgi:hypothetical protein